MDTQSYISFVYSTLHMYILYNVHIFRVHVVEEYNQSICCDMQHILF